MCSWNPGPLTGIYLAYKRNKDLGPLQLYDLGDFLARITKLFRPKFKKTLVLVKPGF